MYYLFVDESWHPEQFRVSGIIVPQGRYTDAIKTVTLQSVRNRLTAIGVFLGRTNGLGLIVEVDLNESKLTEKANDSYSDVKRVSRRDNLWSWVIVRTIEAAVIRLERVKGEIISTVDIYHDRKELTGDHRNVLYEHIKNETPRVFKKLYQTRGATRLRNVSVRRINEIGKATPMEEPNKFQRGVELADTLLRQGDFHRSQNIEIMNITGHVHEIAREDGILR